MDIPVPTLDSDDLQDKINLFINELLIWSIKNWNTCY